MPEDNKNKEASDKTVEPKQSALDVNGKTDKPSLVDSKAGKNIKDVKPASKSNSTDKKPAVALTNNNKAGSGGGNQRNFRQKRTGSSRKRNSRDGKDDDGFEQKIVDLARVTRVMKGGKRMRFRACVVIGNKAGKVAIGLAKSADVTNAIAKATDKAKKNIITVQIIEGTIAHDINHKFGAARIMMKPAPQGRGIIAGGAMRVVLELAGINNIVGKIQGSNNKVNIVKCVIEGLASLKQIDVPQKKEGEKPAKS